jgi:hypothetical protein
MEQEVITINLVAGADLSGSQYRLVAVDNSGKAVAANGATAKVIGVLLNKPGAGQAARVAIAGVTSCVAGAAVNAGDTIVANATGAGIPGNTTGNVIAGRALTGAASGARFQLLIAPSII